MYVPSLPKEWSQVTYIDGWSTGYFAIRDLLVVQRNEEDVAAFHESEKKRWRKVYDEEYVETPQDFYPGDRVEVISDVSVNKDIKNAEGMRGVVTHFDFDDGYESCQTCQSSYPVTVLLDDPKELAGVWKKDGVHKTAAGVVKKAACGCSWLTRLHFLKEDLKGFLKWRYCTPKSSKLRQF